MFTRFLEGFTQIAEEYFDPNRVIEVNYEDYVTSAVVCRNERLILYKTKRNSATLPKLEIVFLNDVHTNFHRAFSLYRTDDEASGKVMFYRLQDKLPLLIQCDISTSKIALQNITQLLREKPSWTAAHIAACCGYLECFKNEVIQSQVNMTCEDTLMTPLLVAVKAQQIGSVVALVGLDVRLDITDANGDTALHYAATTTKDIIQLTEVLIEHGCNVNACNFQGDTALHLMVKHRHLSCAIVLLSHSAEVDAQNGEGNSPLHLAVKNGDLSLVQTFITFGADVDMFNNRGESPRHLAATEKKASYRDILYALHMVGAERCTVPMPSCNDGCNGHGQYSGIPPENCAFSKKYETIFEEVLASMGAQDCGPKPGPHGDNLESCRVLCLDGGGIRGLVLIQMLDELERIVGKPIVNYFDLIAGTSTGAVLALLLATGRTMHDCRCLYFRLKDKVFVGTRPYDAELLENFLKKELGVHKVMGSIEKPRIMIMATRGDRKPADLHIFRNNKSPLEILNYEERDPITKKLLPNPKEELIWQAARASGAAPTYFRASGPFIDGGLISNNPTLDALTEIQQCNQAHIAKGQVDKVINIKVMVSMGTGHPPLVSVNTIDVFLPDYSIWGAAQMAIGVTHLGQLLVDQACQTDGRVTARALAVCNMLNIPYFRLNPQLSEDVALDETNTKTLIKMLWETTAYMRCMRKELEKLKNLLIP